MRRGRVNRREKKIGINLWGVRERERERRWMNLWGHWGGERDMKLWGEEETKSEGHKIGMTLWLLVIV